MAYAWVCDASAIVGLALSEEEGPAVERVVEQAIEQHDWLLVPSLFWPEVGNALLAASRRKRISAATAGEILRDLEYLPIETEPAPDEATRDAILALAVEHDLSYYDATYLELPLRRGLRLVTLDSHLLALRPRYDFIQ